MRRPTTSCAALFGALFMIACGSNKSSGAGGDDSGGESSSATGSTASGATGSGGASSASSGSSDTVSNVSDGSVVSASAVTGTTGFASDPVDGPLTGADEGMGGGSSEGGEGGAGSDPPDLDPGVLTAGIWDDNQNFDWFSGYYQDQQASQLVGWFDLDSHETAQEAYQQAQGSYEMLDIALVIDTTGSMGDELEYLQVEFDAISSAIEERYGNAQQRWALVVYRDEGDEYVTQSYAFTDSPDAFRADLAEQSFGGGGDFPEAPDRALEDMNLLDWRDDASALRLAFWVADAPHHQEPANVDRLVQAIVDAQDQTIRINPIASSGIDEFTELTMRSTAQLTQGQYLFLTDDSGVGGEHKDPTVPCYYVTTLADAFVRVVDAAMTGEPAPVDQNQVVRSVGDPDATGSCDLDGVSAEAF